MLQSLQKADVVDVFMMEEFLASHWDLACKWMLERPCLVDLGGVAVQGLYFVSFTVAVLSFEYANEILWADWCVWVIRGEHLAADVSIGEIVP